MPRRPTLPAPADVVSGRARVTIEQLFALIHDVNPTDKGLSPRAQSEAYALKSRLQSLLIRQHADFLVVERHASDERVVSIQHRTAGRDACHAVVPSLDDDARRWVETELGLAERRARTAEKPGAAPTAGPKTRGSTPSNDPITAGRAALDAYDYDEARRLFSEAFAASPANVDAVEALLDLLVNHVADDEAAVALGARLVPPATESPVVLGCLGLAAARLGDGVRARRWLRGADATHAAEAWALLADHAIREGSPDDVNACVAAIQEVDRGHRALPKLKDAVARLRADERAPAEASLTSAVKAADWDAVDRLGREVLARWPESEVARSAQRDLQRHRREQEGRDLVARAWQAWERGDPKALLVAVGQARALGVADEETRAWMDEAEVIAREQVEIADIRSTKELFVGGKLVAALKAWLLLPAGARAELRAAFNLQELAWLDLVPAGDGRVEAVVALGEAQTAFLLDDVDRAANLLEPHARTLRGVPDARSLADDIAKSRAELGVRTTQTTTGLVNAARVAGDFDRALTLCAALPPDLRRRARAEIEGERLKDGRRRLRKAALASDDLLRARALAREDGDTAVVTGLTTRIRQEWQISVWEGVDIGVIDVHLPLDPRCPLPWLTDDGDAFVYVQVLAGWVFARVVDLGTLVVRRVVSMRAPEAIQVHYVHVEAVAGQGDGAGDVVITVVDNFGALLAFRLSDGDIVRFLPRPPGTLADDTMVLGTTMAPGGRYLWMAFNAFAHQEMRVYDTEKWPSFRSLPFGYPSPLLGCDEPRVAILSFEKGATVHAPNGNPGGRRTFLEDSRCSRVTAHPGGYPMCALTDSSDRRLLGRERLDQATKDALPSDPVGFSAILPDRINGTLSVYPSSRISHPHQVAVARSEGAVYTKMGPGGVSRIVTHLEQPDGKLAGVENEVWVPTTTLLLTDPQGLRVRAIALCPAGLRAVPLDDTLSSPTQAEAHQENYLSLWPDSGLDFSLGCRYEGETLTETGQILLKTLKPLTRAKQDEWISSFKLVEDNGTSLFDLASVLTRLDRRVEAEVLFEETGARFPDHPRWRLLRANVDARNGL